MQIKIENKFSIEILKCFKRHLSEDLIIPKTKSYFQA